MALESRMPLVARLSTLIVVFLMYTRPAAVSLTSSKKGTGSSGAPFFRFLFRYTT